MPIRTDDIPQSARLIDLRALLLAVAGGVGSIAGLVASLGCTARTVTYRLRAATGLGWLEGEEESLRLSPTGLGLLGTRVGSPEERACFSSAIRSHPVVQSLIPDLLDGTWSREEVAARMEAAGLAASTARSRASTLLGWKEQATRPGGQLLLFELLSTGAEEDVRQQNPWWAGRPMRRLPAFRRTFFPQIERILERGWASIVVLRGPRQVGKTTAQSQLITDLLGRGVPPERILRVQFDQSLRLLKAEEPILEVARWFEARVLRGDFNAAAQDGQPCWLFFDEVQWVPDWAPQLKSLVDGAELRVVVTGSSALRIREGDENLAGRSHTIEVGTFSLREIGAIRGIDLLPSLLNGNGNLRMRDRSFWIALRDQGNAEATDRDAVFTHFSSWGGYPLCHRQSVAGWEEVAPLLADFVRKVQGDLAHHKRADPLGGAVLAETFHWVCAHAGEAPGGEKLRQSLLVGRANPVTPRQLDLALEALEEALLIHRIRANGGGRGAQAELRKLCLSDHALRAAELGERVPLDPASLVGQPELAQKAGLLAESVLGTWLSRLGEDTRVEWQPERKGKPEVDFVLQVGARLIPIEVKYQSRIDKSDCRGLHAFLEAHPEQAEFGLLVTREDVPGFEDERVVALPLSSLLLAR